MQDFRAFAGHDASEVSSLVRHKHLFKVTLDDIHPCSL